MIRSWYDAWSGGGLQLALTQDGSIDPAILFLGRNLVSLHEFSFNSWFPLKLHVLFIQLPLIYTDGYYGLQNPKAKTSQSKPDTYPNPQQTLQNTVYPLSILEWRQARVLRYHCSYRKLQRTKIPMETSKLLFISHNRYTCLQLNNQTKQCLESPHPLTFRSTSCL